MRNFDQRMTEIKSRSHARIIRRRKQLTSFCAVFAVALCCSGTLLLHQQPNEVIVEDPTSTTQTVAVYTGSVTVSENNNILVHTDEETVESVLSLLKELPLEHITMTDINGICSERVQTTSLPPICSIEIQIPDGEVARYKLQGKTLLNEETSEIFSLTDQQRLELLRLLGLYE